MVGARHDRAAAGRAPRFEVAAHGRARGLASPPRRRAHAQARRRGLDLVERRARRRRELQLGREQLRAKARGFRGVHRSRAPARFVLARLERRSAALTMGRALRVLLVEDSPDDAALLERELRRIGWTPSITRVETEKAMR